VGEEAVLVERLRAGDEHAFVTLVGQYHAPLLRLVGTFVPSKAVAEEVVQDTWLGVVRGIDRFEGRASLKTWLYTIAVNRARTTGVRERKQIPTDLHAEAVDPRRFTSGGTWAEPPSPWTDASDDRLDASDLAGTVARLIEQLPDAQRQVVSLRDVHGLSSDDVCGMLAITLANQRVLLHRGRSKVRATLEREMGRG
jgi:RNA polymerase sigma-70 factor, ECF subfamily